MIVETLSCRKLCGVMQFTKAKNFHPWNSLPVNAGVWWWCTETASFMERVFRAQKWVGINCTSQPSRSRKCEHSTSGGTGFGKPTIHNLRFIHCTGVICENCTQHCPCRTGIQQCVSAWWVPRWVMEVHKNWCLEVLFHFFSHLKEEQMVPLNPWWHGEAWVHHFTQNEL